MINIALIGYGYWGSKLKGYIEDNGNFNIKRICCSKDNLSEVWGDKSISAVVIATPNHTHYEITRQALISGKQVLVEKPLALEWKQCLELAELAAKSNLILSVEYTHTFSRALRMASRMAREGIGTLLGGDMSVRHLGRFGGGSVYWLLGSHMLSILSMFVPLDKLTYRKHDIVVYQGVVETGSIVFDGLVKGQITLSLNYPVKELNVTLFGSKGTLVYTPTESTMLSVDLYEKPIWEADIPTEHMVFHFDESNNLKYAVEYFYNALNGNAESNVGVAIEITRILQELQTCSTAIL